MNTKQYLQQAFFLDRQISAYLGELEELRALAESVSSTLIVGERVKVSGKVDWISDIITKIVDLENQIKTDISRYLDIKRDIRELINQVGDAKLKLILQKRYINFETWERIAADLDINLRWAYRLHGMALQEFAKK
jgi:hypothetical protein